MSESQEAVVTERRLALVDPVPNPRRRVTDRAAALAEGTARDGHHDLAGVPPWLCRYSRGLRVADLAVGLAAAVLALLIRFGEDPNPVYLVLNLLFPFGWVLFLAANRAYEPRFSIDELPQLLNVLVGQMSLVGPRPPLPDEVSQYGGDVGRRLLVRPGLTGLWQVSGRSEMTWEQAVRLDLEYVENWSLSLDLAILCRTLSAVVRSRGAY